MPSQAQILADKPRFGSFKTMFGPHRVRYYTATGPDRVIRRGPKFVVIKAFKALGREFQPGDEFDPGLKRHVFHLYAQQGLVKPVELELAQAEPEIIEPEIVVEPEIVPEAPTHNDPAVMDHVAKPPEPEEIVKPEVEAVEPKRKQKTKPRAGRKIKRVVKKKPKKKVVKKKPKSFV